MTSNAAPVYNAGFGNLSGVSANANMNGSSSSTATQQQQPMSFETFSSVRRRQQSTTDTNAVESVAAAAGIDTSTIPPSALLASSKTTNSLDAFQSSFTTMRLFLFVVLADILCVVLHIVTFMYGPELEAAFNSPAAIAATSANPTVPRVILPIFYFCASAIVYISWVLCLISFAEITVYGVAMFETQRRWSWYRIIDALIVGGHLCLLIMGSSSSNASYHILSTGDSSGVSAAVPAPAAAAAAGGGMHPIARLIVLGRVIRVSECLDLIFAELSTRSTKLDTRYLEEKSRAELLQSQVEQMSSKLEGETASRIQSESLTRQLAARNERLTMALVIAAEQTAQVLGPDLAGEFVDIANVAADAEEFGVDEEGEDESEGRDRRRGVMDNVNSRGGGSGGGGVGNRRQTQQQQQKYLGSTTTTTTTTTPTNGGANRTGVNNTITTGLGANSGIVKPKTGKYAPPTLPSLSSSSSGASNQQRSGGKKIGLLPGQTADHTPYRHDDDDDDGNSFDEAHSMEDDDEDDGIVIREGVKATNPIMTSTTTTTITSSNNNNSNTQTTSASTAPQQGFGGRNLPPRGPQQSQQQQQTFGNSTTAKSTSSPFPQTSIGAVSVSRSSVISRASTESGGNRSSGGTHHTGTIGSRNSSGAGMRLKVSATGAASVV